MFEYLVRKWHLYLRGIIFVGVTFFNLVRIGTFFELNKICRCYITEYSQKMVPL